MNQVKTVLETKEITMRFGGLTAVNSLNMAVPQGSIVGLIGPNGAGKTTVFNMITGFYTPTEGSVFFNGNEITGLPPYKVCETGIARTFQNIRLFTNETVLQNVMIGCHVRQKSKWWMAPFLIPSMIREEKEIREKSMKLLESVALAQHADELSSSLPYGAQRRLEIARALATEPSFLLLDEPAAGMNPLETVELMAFIRRIRDEFNLTILLIEHDMKVVMGICEYIWVLDYGKLIAEGDPEAIQSNPRVIEAYLGEEYAKNA
ncbi:MAG: ABC transporter ATP-binding protein [Aminobacterium sp.]|jgi:branched-chain amino acid transport system ATP-binding protein|nr:MULTISPECIES: ABC transporter ATP-binding protein [unclassified Aminobacterium]MDD2206181.1 ABC transporter ATP-binding protein [Aminobacterium sp.]MDD3426434.1 ABC transporter ATP-binding protein [Aminobacterium sp.]MDD3707080.1 ABC transporter ATP-binding protein [Aminobacterium sp.]MDD4227975.1 ABC transporter ATP-binding protein [Aminobacterium sp.]MDD4551178.1 ABC transporter ATP-binding protein [Aminobacterium sp.]